MKKIFIFGYYGFKNAGDDAILDSIIRDFRKKDENISFSVLTYNSEYIKNRFNVEPVSRSRYSDIIKHIKNSDLVISGGGSLLQDVTSSRSLYYYIAMILLAKFFGKRVMFYCNGYGPVTKPRNKSIMKWVVSKVDLITLRDEKSYEEIISMENNSNVYLTADAAFTMEKQEDSRIDDILKAEGISHEGNLVGISVRPWKNDKNTIDLFRKVARFLIEKGYKVVFIPMKFPDDKEISEEILKGLDNSAYVIKNYYSPSEVSGILGKCNFIIGVRLHSLIFSAINEIPFIGVEYDPKIKAFCQMVEQNNAGDIENLTFDQICNNILELEKEYDSRLAKIKKYKSILKGKVNASAQMGIDLLTK